MDRTVLEAISKACSSLDGAVNSLILAAADTTQLLKKESSFNGTPGVWRRVGGMNLFLRSGDGVIMNGPQALSGQPMGNINSDDFRAIPHVREIHSRQGASAAPGEDISEKASGTNVTTLVADHAKAVVTKGFGRVSVTLHSKVSNGRYEAGESKDFPFSGKKGEVAVFESAKAWTRKKLRAKGRNKIKPKAKK